MMSMRESFIKINFMEKEFINIIMEMYFKVFGLMGKKMEKVDFSLLMET